MKKMLVFVFIMAIGVATLLAPVNAQEASGQTEVGYTTNTTVEIPGGSIGPTTGDHTALGEKEEKKKKQPHNKIDKLWLYTSPKI